MSARLFSLIAAEPYLLDPQTLQVEKVSTGRWGDFPIPTIGGVRLVGVSEEGLVGGISYPPPGDAQIDLISADGALSWNFDLLGLFRDAYPSPWSTPQNVIVAGRYVHGSAHNFDDNLTAFFAIPITSIKEGSPYIEKTAETEYAASPFAATDDAIVFPRYSPAAGNQLFLLRYNNGGEEAIYTAPGSGHTTGGAISARVFASGLYVLTAGTSGLTSARVVYITPQGASDFALPYVDWVYIASPDEVWIDRAGADGVSKRNAQLEVVDVYAFDRPPGGYTLAFLEDLPTPAPDCFWTDLVGVVQTCGGPE